MSENLKKMKPKEMVEERSSAKLQTAIIIGVIGLAVLMGVAFAIGSLGNGKDLTAQQAGGQASTAAPGSSANPSAASTASFTSVEVLPISIYRQRNPFKPLVNMVAPVVTTTSAAAGAGEVAVVTVPPELANQTNAAGQVLSRSVTLNSITKRDGQMLASITIAGQAFDNIAAGQTFGNNFKLLSLDNNSGATILYGDERFTFAVGQSRYW